MAAISEKVNGNESVESWTNGEQLKAKKNKSNLFLIKSYSFIERNNNNNMNINNNNNNSNNQNDVVKMPAVKLLQSPDMEAFPEIASLVLAQVSDAGEQPTKKARLKLKKQKQPKIKGKRGKAQEEQEQQQQQLEEQDFISEQEAQLLRRNAHEYEELLQHLPAPHIKLARPQSLPAKVHFETTIEALDNVPQPAKRRGAHIKRESFLRQSLQSIRRSFGSNKHSSKLSMATHVVSMPGSSSASTASTSSSSTTTSSCSSATAISLLSKAQAQNHLLDDFLPTPVVLLLNDEDDDDADRILAAQNQYFGQDLDMCGGTHRAKRSSSSVVSTVATCGNSNSNSNNCGTNERPTTSMALLQLPASGNNSAAATTSDKPGTATATTTTTTTTTLTEQQQQQLQQVEKLLQQRRLQYAPQLSLPETFGPEHSSLAQSYSSSVGPLQSSGSAQSLGGSPSPVPRHSQGQGKGGSGVGLTAGKGGNTAKQHEQQASAAAAISSTSAAAGVGAGAGAGVATTSAAAGSAVAAATPPEKEKKRKEVSSSRVKKFHRHFTQVSNDEKLINYFSCALVGDIPLQGHLYITEEHFAFYSNVFGYVTKVVIPTSSVTKISKEKTVKIIPNAVGVATAEERHVFGSFISRESAFRLMCTVCSHLAPGAEILPKPLPVDVELTEEYIIDDDSSCSISGNESPPQLRDPATLSGAVVKPEPQTLLRQRAGSDRHSDHHPQSSLDVPHGTVTARSSAPPIIHYEEQPLVTSSTSANGSAGSSSSPPSSSSSPVTVVGVAAPTVATVGGTPARSVGGRLTGLAHSARSQLSLRLPTLTELHLLYLGIMLAIMLALFSVFLLYRILDIEAKTSLYNTPVDFNLRSGDDEDIFAEALRWQKELQDKSTAEAQHILSKNLEQISKVRRSLETLSMLIHDRRAGYVQPQAEPMPESADHAHGDVSD